jgi:hypothetical protein
MVKLARQESALLEIRRGQFVEVASQMLATYVGYGECNFSDGPDRIRRRATTKPNG